ncbi:hypothetical protein CYMTET_44770, partial [Cymbomonas tetramitiformis]
VAAAVAVAAAAAAAVAAVAAAAAVTAAAVTAAASVPVVAVEATAVAAAGTRATVAAVVAVVGTVMGENRVWCSCSALTLMLGNASDVCCDILIAELVEIKDWVVMGGPKATLRFLALDTSQGARGRLSGAQFSSSSSEEEGEGGPLQGPLCQKAPAGG